MIWELSGDYPKEGGDTLTTLVYDFLKKSSQKPLYGDVNGDNIVNSNDLTLLRRYILEIIDSFPFPGGLVNADVNCDGLINSLDYNLIQRYILEIIDKLPVNWFYKHLLSIIIYILNF